MARSRAPRPRPPARHPRQALADRRGVAGVMFTLSAMVVLGLVGLGTEGGAWYLTRRDAQNAADAAAYAGAVRLALAQRAPLSLDLAGAQQQAREAAGDTAARNGFAGGQNATTVTANTPPATGPFAGNTTAVEVIIQRTRPRMLSALFLAADPVIATRGVAARQSLGHACLLGLSLGIRIEGNTTVNAPDCVVASNREGDDSIRIRGSPTIDVAGFVSVGECDGCASTGEPVTEYNLAGVTDPYATQVAPVPFPPATPCFNLPNIPSSPPFQIPALAMATHPAYPAVGPILVFCNNVQINNGATLDLLPGTYYFFNRSFTVTSGTVRCSTCAVGGAGVTLVFAPDAGGRVGDFTLNGGAVILNAPAGGPYNGILIYRDDAESPGGAADVLINGNNETRLAGAIYAPNGDVQFNGNAGIADNGNCLVLVGESIQLSGTAGTTSGCDSLGFQTPEVQIIRLVE